MTHAPKKIHLENVNDIIKHIDNIYSQAIVSYAMPPGNITGLENSERKILSQLHRFVKNL